MPYLVLITNINFIYIARAENEIGNLLQDETEFTLDTLSDEEVEILPDNPYIATRKVLLKVDYPIKDVVSIPYKYQYLQNFSYNIEDYNQGSMEEEQYKAMEQVNYKLKYPELQNLRYDTNTQPPSIYLTLTANDIEAGFIGFHDFSEVPTQNYSPSYSTNSTDISVDPVLEPNNVVFDPVAITPYDKVVSTSSMRGITRDSNVFEPPFYAVDFKNNINVARSITVSPQNFPYTFSIANYNNDNNTNYIGVRSLVVNSSGGSSVIDVYKYKGSSSTVYTLSDMDTRTISESLELYAGQSLLYIYDFNSLYEIHLITNSSSSGTKYISLSIGTRYKRFTTNYSEIWFLNDQNENILSIYGTTSGNYRTSLYKSKFNLVFN